MLVKDLIELLAKQNWDAKILVDNRINVAPADACDTTIAARIHSLSSFTEKGKPIVTINTGRK